jgi:hypothetical protein
VPVVSFDFSAGDALSALEKRFAVSQVLKLFALNFANHKILYFLAGKH